MFVASEEHIQTGGLGDLLSETTRMPSLVISLGVPLGAPLQVLLAALNFSQRNHNLPSLAFISSSSSFCVMDLTVASTESSSTRW